STSIKRKVTALVLVVIGVSSLMMVGAIFLYYRIRAVGLLNAENERLMATAAAQANALVIGYILPEQRDGLALLLDKFRREEGLSISEITDDVSRLPGFEFCRMKAEMTSCIDKNRTQVAVVTPIREGNRIFAYHVKARKINFGEGNRDFLTIATLILGCLF